MNYKKEKEEEEEEEEEEKEDSNDIMNKAFIRMEQIWKRYEDEYDNIHGEFAFADKYRLKPDTEYETDYDSEENEELNEDLNTDLLF
jgi:hypothetical protein